MRDSLFDVEHIHEQKSTDEWSFVYIFFLSIYEFFLASISMQS